jgi:FAD/FMN-containing dehydrogenase
MNDLGTRFVNSGKYLSSILSHGSIFFQPHVAFHFLLDYVPNWKQSYGSGGLIQYQCFIPAENAQESIRQILLLCQKKGLRNYLSVLKRHRSDRFLISHGVDGYSLAMDFRITPRRQPKIVKLASELDQIVINAGGRFYLAKDSTLNPETVQSYLGSEVINSFWELKRRTDPDQMLQTNLWRRLFY